MPRFSFRFVLGWAALALVLSACSGPPQATSDGGRQGGPSVDDAAAERGLTQSDFAAAETFDPSAYPVQSPKRDVDVTHAVPARLMTSRAAQGVTQTVEGFRIQVYSAQDKRASEEFREEVRQWWQTVQDEAPGAVFRERPPIVIEYTQPYYRVRIGAFASRDEAEEALSFIHQKYPDAFMARSTVTVTRR